jgi:hypothetical protein
MRAVGLVIRQSADPAQMVRRPHPASLRPSTVHSARPAYEFRVDLSGRKPACESPWLILRALLPGVPGALVPAGLALR